MRYLLALSLLVVSSAHAITMEMIEERAGLPWTDKFRANMDPMVTHYNKQKRHKAVAVGVGPDNKRVAIGRSWKQASQLAAAFSAVQTCEQERSNRSIEGSCEVVLSNEIVIPLGKSYFDDIDASAPSNVWYAQHEGATIYLVGTIHVLKPSIFPLPPVFDVAYEQADRIALESNILLMSEPTRQVALQKQIAADPKLVKRSMSRQLKRALKRYTKQHGGNINSLYPIKPIITSLQINQIANMSHGYSGATGIEMHYSRKAMSDGKAIIELEDPIETMQLMTDLPMDIQFLALGDTLERYSDLPVHFQQVLATWINSDADGIYNFASEPFRRIKELNAFGEAFLDRRNQKMFENMLPLLEADKTTTVMVGAAHLGGPDGLINILRRNGIELEQLNMSGQPVVKP